MLQMSMPGDWFLIMWNGGVLWVERSVNGDVGFTWWFHSVQSEKKNAYSVAAFVYLIILSELIDIMHLIHPV